jgi:hypothetical protein
VRNGASGENSSRFHKVMILSKDLLNFGAGDDDES